MLTSEHGAMTNARHGIKCDRSNITNFLTSQSHLQAATYLKDALISRVVGTVFLNLCLAEQFKSVSEIAINYPPIILKNIFLLISLTLS